MPPSSPSRQLLTGEVCTAVKPAAAMSGMLSLIVLKSQLNACKMAPFATFCTPVREPEALSAEATGFSAEVCEAAEEEVFFFSSLQPPRDNAVPVSKTAASKDVMILICN